MSVTETVTGSKGEGEGELSKEDIKNITAGAVDNSADAEPPVGPCPYDEIIKAYHDELPECRRVEILTEKRKASIRARWRNEAATLREWVWLFKRIRTSPFLMGKVNGTNGRAPFIADLDWIIRPTNFVAIAEGKYAQKGA